MNKRIIFVVLAIASTIGTLANDELNHSLGLQLGWNRQIYRLNSPSVFGDDKEDLSKDPLNGGKIGFVYELAHESGVGLFTALNYSYTWHRTAYEKIPYTKEGKPATIEWSNLEYSRYSQSHVLDINAHFQYKFALAFNTYLVVYTGPSFQYIAKYLAEDNFRYNDEEIDVRYYFEDKMRYNAEDMAQYYKRWNFTWGLGAAFQYDLYFIRGGYDFGLVNPYNIATFGEPIYSTGEPVFPDPDNDHYPDTRLTRGRLDSWYVTIGFYLWRTDN